MALKLTPSGRDLLMRTLAGTAHINFAAIQLGNGADAGADAAALSNPLLTVELTGYEVGDIFVTLTAIFSNSDVPAGFRAAELGVLADDPDNAGGTLLYAYEYTPEDKADYIPSSTDKVLETQMDVLVYIGDAANVTASISQSMAYASKAEFDNFVGRRDNPHGVDKEQVGLGLVPNVPTNDQTPTYTVAANPTALKSGEMLSVAMGKLARAVIALIDHLAAKGNPHGVTAAQVGAAQSVHKHSATDITSGILGVARGGTAVTSLSQLRKNLTVPTVSTNAVTIQPTQWIGDKAPYTILVNVPKVTTQTVVEVAVAPDPDQAAEAGRCGVLCTAQMAGKLGWTAYRAKPTIAITYHVKMTEV